MFHGKVFQSFFKSPLYHLVIIALSIFSAELLVMFFISLFYPISMVNEAVIDAVLLVILVSPILYIFLFRPLLLHISERKRTEMKLQEAHNELEERVEIRTAELAKANEKLKNDIKERKKLEEQLLHAQKMEAIGTLTGGISHEFNNIITTIISCGEFLQDEMDEDSPLKSFVDVIHVSAHRAADLTNGLLAFSRKNKIDKRLVSINRLIQKVEGLLSKTIGEDIRIEIDITEMDPAVMVDSSQIEQVLMNLATNARDAMPKGGLLSIRSELVEIDNEFIKEHGYGRQGLFARIIVADTGTGMNKATLEKIFEPFFTTKEVGKGTGLGLSMVYGIIKKHDGFIDVKSSTGFGTAFNIFLPFISSGTEEVNDEPVESHIEGGTETVLIAEDDPVLRKVVRKLFDNAGYNIIEAVDGNDAFKKFSENKEKIQFMLFDFIMPGMNGKEALDRIREIDPDIKVIFMTGYRDRVDDNEMIKEGLVVIEKPFSPKLLLRKVREMLDKELIKE